MKKIISILLSVIILLGVTVSAIATEDPVKNMMHVKLTQTSGNDECVMLKLEDLEAGSYTVSFNYYSENHKFDNDYIFAVFGNNSGNFLWDSTIYQSTRNDFASKEIDEYSAEYQFNISEQHLTNFASGIYVGFRIKKLATCVEFYFSNLVMYKTDDESKTNILTKDDYSTSLNGWYSENTDLSNSTNVKTFGTVAYEPYVKSYFEPIKTMLHVNVAEGTSVPSYGVILSQKMPYLEGSTSYTFEFKYNQADVAFGDDFSVYVTGTYSTVENGWDKTVVRPAGFTTDTDTYATVKLSFTPSSNNYGYNSTYIGFVMMKAVEFYVADIVLYKTNDSEKTNLLSKNEYSSDMSGWYAESQKAADGAVEFNGSKYVEYNEELFEEPERPKTVFHAMRQTPALSGDYECLALKIPHEAGNYTVSFKTYSPSQEIDTDYYPILMGDNGNGYWSKTLINFKGQANAVDEISFEITDDHISGYGALYFSFAVPAEIDLYISDFVLYKTDDENKENLFACDEHSTNDAISNWFTEYKPGDKVESLFTAFEYIPYGSGDANNDSNVDICDLVNANYNSKGGFNPLADVNLDGKLDAVDVSTIRATVLNSVA